MDRKNFSTTWDRLKILVARVDTKAPSLVQRLSELGAQAEFLPCILIRPENPELIQQAVRAFTQAELAIFVSGNAVAAVMSQLEPQKLAAAQLQVIAVGASTAEKLNKAGFTQVIFPQQEQNTEGILALASLQEVAGKKIIILRGPPGRELLAASLRKRAAIVQEFAVYQREPCSGQITLPTVAKGHSLLIVATSGEIITNLAQRLAPFSQQPRFMLLVPSPRLFKLAQDLGFQQIKLAPSATDESIITALQEISNKG